MLTSKGVMVAVSLVALSIGLAGAQEIQIEIEPDDFEWRPVPASTPSVTSKGEMVTSPEFKNIQNLLTGLNNFNPASKGELEEKKGATQSAMDDYLKAMEEKTLSGRWVRKFFESEVEVFFTCLAVKKGFAKPKPLAEEERITRFWKELDNCLEGIRTLQTFKEYDLWFCDLLEDRCRDSFKMVKGVPFKERLETLKLTPEKYKEFLTKLIDGLFSYRQAIRPNTPAVLLGKAKEELSEVMVRPPKGSWVAHNSRKDKEFFESDLVEMKSKETKEVVLADRRYIVLEGKSIMCGWELQPQIPPSLGKEIAHLIELLNHDDWQTREEATAELIAIGEPAIGPLKEALKHPEPEVRMRAGLILKKIDKSAIEQQVRTMVLEHINQHRYPPYDQLMQLGDQNQILNILRTIMGEQSQGTNQWVLLNYMVRQLERNQRW